VNRPVDVCRSLWLECVFFRLYSRVSQCEIKRGETGSKQREQVAEAHNPRPDLKRGRDDDGRASAGGATPGHTELIEENKRRLKALSQRYPGQLELRAPLRATPLSLRVQAQTAARFAKIS
jgi:hypothetical protein